MARRKLPYVVQYRDKSHPYWEDIAAFNCEPVAVSYAEDCQRANFDPADRYERRWRAVKPRSGGRLPRVLS